jgi:beta-lactam-binding protein with PASTA domain
MPNTPILQGSEIDLIVGAGLYNQTTQVPDLQGILLDDALLLLLDVGLQPGKINYKPSTTNPPNVIIAQNPYADNRIKLGSFVDLWISETEEKVTSENKKEHNL